MKRQIGFAEAEIAGKKRVTRRQRFLAEMEKIVPWQRLLSAIVSGGANPTLHGGARLSRGVNNRVDRWRRLLSAPIVSQNGSASMSRG
jgi:hypothetical protein